MRTVLIAVMLLAATPAAAGGVERFDIEGASSTWITAASPAGIVAGHYTPLAADACGTECGFLRTPDGTVTTFSLFGSSFLNVAAVNDSGTVVGRYQQGEDVRGFVRTLDGTVTDLASASFDIFPTAINESGVIAGEASRRSRNYGFSRALDGTITTFRSGACGRDTLPRSINAAGEIAGICALRAFLREPDGTMKVFKAPGGMITQGWYVDDSGAVAGNFWSGSANAFFIRNADGTSDTFSPFPPSSAIRVAGMATIDGTRRLAGEVQENGQWHRQGFVADEGGTADMFNGATRHLKKADTLVYGMAASGMVAGTSIIGSKAHGFIRMP